MKSSIIEISKILESKIRLQMIASLSVSDLTYKQLKTVCQCTDGNMTTHTTKLIESGFVTVKKEFENNKPKTTYHLTEQGRTEFEEYVQLLNNLYKKR